MTGSGGSGGAYVGDGLDALIVAEERRRRTHGAANLVLAAGAAVAWALFQFRKEVEDQLGRLHTPLADGRTIKDLHGHDVQQAVRTWRQGKQDLRPFDPLGHRELIYQHSGVGAAFTVVVSIVLIALVRRYVPKRIWVYPVIGVYAVVSMVSILIDLSIAQLEGTVTSTFDGWFPALDLVRVGSLGLIVVAVVSGLLTRAPNERHSVAHGHWSDYRGSPASARMALAVGLLFFVVCNLGDIGAQLDDLLRRELYDGSGARQAGQLALLAGVLCLYAVVLVALNGLDAPRGSGTRPSPALITALGAGLVVAGAALWWRGAQLEVALAGVMLLVVGFLSARTPGGAALAKRPRVALRAAAGLLVVGVALFVLGAAFGHDVHLGLLVAGAVAIAVGLGVGWLWWPRRVGGMRGPDLPPGADGAGILVLLGLALMVVSSDPDDAGNVAVAKGMAFAGLGLAIVGALLLFWVRRGAPRLLVLDVVALGAVAAGIWAAYGDERLHWWALLAVVGVVVLVGNQQAYAPSPWMGAPSCRPPPPPTSTRDPELEADATGVLVLAATLPFAGLLVVTARALSSVLAAGGPPPLMLVAFAGLLVVGAAGAGWWITRRRAVEAAKVTKVARSAAATPKAPPVPWWKPVLLGVVAASFPVTALASILWDDGEVAERVGSWFGALALLVLLLAWVAAAAGVIRLATLGRTQPLVFKVLGFRRTPVNGLVLTWLLLVMVMGAPLERTAASSHDLRLTDPAPAEALLPAPCPEGEVRAAVSDAAGPAHDLGPVDSVTQELCRWLVRQVGPNGRPTAPLPLVLVSASGGGVRAASWTTRVVDCVLFRPATARPAGSPCQPTDATRDPWASVFAMGGASGGSVGEVTAVAQQIAPIPASGAVEKATGPDWATSVAEHDHLRAVAGQMVVGELGLAPLGIVPEHDRAETLIDSWSDPFGEVQPTACEPLAAMPIEDVGFLRAHAACPERVPLLLLNGTVVRTGSRFDISPLDAAGEDQQLGLRDVLCPGDDVPLFDAAFLSGRFPLVTPSAHIGTARPDGCTTDVASPVDVVDGGYHENSGTAQLRDLWATLGPLLERYAAARAKTPVLPEIRPVFLQIVNGGVDNEKHAYDSCAKPVLDENAPNPTSGIGGRALDVGLGEPLRIPWGLYEARVRASAAEAEDEFSADQLVRRLCADGVPVVTLGLFDYPGRPLPLGWSLTNDVLRDLGTLLRLEPNRCRVEQLIHFLGDPASVPPTRPIKPISDLVSPARCPAPPPVDEPRPPVCDCEPVPPPPPPPPPTACCERGTR